MNSREINNEEESIIEQIDDKVNKILFNKSSIKNKSYLPEKKYRQV